MPAQAAASRDAAPPPARSVEARLGFTRPSAETLFAYAYDPPEGRPRSNIVIDQLPVRVEDISPIAASATLDVEGFEIIDHRTAVRDFWDDAQTLALGHPEAAEIVRAATGASRVVVFDHTLRKRLPGAEDRSSGLPRQPAARAHVDQTVRSGPQRIRDLMGDQAEALLQRRAAIINVWRPVAHPARDWPLAVGDARTFDLADLVPTELRFAHRTGEIYGVAHRQGQRWVYAPELRPDQALLIKCWDSDATVARFAPHTAFEDPTTPAGAPPRESIEFRTIAFFD